MKKYQKITLASSILGLIVLSASSLLISKYSNNIEETFAQTLPTNVNVTDLTDAQVNSYYAGVENKSGDQLLSALYTIIDGHREYSYGSESDRYAYKIIDRNWSLNPLTPAQLANFSHENDMPYIHKLYADYNDSITTADLFKNPGAGEVSFDKEHIWAQSLGLFGRTNGAGSDFHALWPADKRANSFMHNNNNFAVPETDITNYEGDTYNGTDKTIPDRSTYVGRNGYISGSSQKVCEPLDEYKGDVARAMFYMPARYYVYIDATHPKLTLVNGSPLAVTASPTQPGLAGDLATLLLWNELDPVDEYEIHRNNLIYNNYQLNRNPFIDHPEWARIAFDTSYSGPGASTAAGTSSVGDGGETVLVTDINLDNSTLTMGVGSQHTLTATVLPINATNKTLSWSSTNQNVATVSNGVISAVSAGTATITATATDGSAVYESCSLTVTAEAQKILEYIQVSGATATAPYGSTYNTSPIVVTAYYDDLSSENVTSSSTINLPNTSVLGQQSVSVSYLTKTAYYSVDVTNNGAIVTGEEIGTQYVSETAVAGAITGWTGYDLGDAYADGSVKLDETGDYIYKTDIWSDFSSQNIVKIDLVIKIKQNGGTDEITANELQVFAINGTTNTEIASVTQTAGFDTTASEEILNIIIENPSTITGLKIIYKTKVLGNLGIYYIKATPTYQIGSHIEQAEAWASYFLAQTSEQCSALQPQESEVWSRLENEFDWMDADSRILYDNSGETSLIQSAIARYSAIINAHPENTPFISYVSTANEINTIKVNNNFIVVFILVSISFLSVATFLMIKKEKYLTR